MQIEQRMYKIASLDLIQGKYNIIELQNIWDYYIFKKKKSIFVLMKHSYQGWIHCVREHRCVMNTGYVLEMFEISREIRQGSP